MSESPESSKDGMQFEQAEYVAPGGMTCTSCGNKIEATYWHWGGNVICLACAAAVEQAQKTPQKGLLLRGALYALGTALACSIGYATILLVTNYELAIVAIGVGWAVGTAARKGTQGAGGRPVQIVAVAATYLAICFSLGIQVLYQWYKEGKEIELFSVLFAFALSLGKPFLELRYEGFGAILGLVILFFGLQQAWKQTGNLDMLLMGPYEQAKDAHAAS